MLLDANTRRMILKMPFAREMSNWLVNVNNSNFYSALNRKMHYKKKIETLKGIHKGKRCFIVGNGPSLSVDQLNKIKNEGSFGANRIYKMFDKSEWKPTFYVIQDPYDYTAKDIYEKINVPYLFVSDYYWRKRGMSNRNAICYHINRKLRQSEVIPFSEDVSSYIQAAATVSYTMIQLAVYFGYEEIYLIGMDHNYATVTDDKGKVIKVNNVKNHAFEDENPKEVVANIDYMESAYIAAKNYCEENNVIIRNATIGGSLEVFERINFNDLFKKKESE